MREPLGDRFLTFDRIELNKSMIKAGYQVELAYNNIMHLEPINRAEIQRKLGEEEHGG